MTMTASKPKMREVRCDHLLWVNGEEKECHKLLAVVYEDRIEIKCRDKSCGNVMVVRLKG